LISTFVKTFSDSVKAMFNYSILPKLYNITKLYASRGGYMKGRSVALFALGLLLALLAYPVALFVSFPLAYAFAVIALMLGAVLALRSPRKVSW